ncbi:uncharacterized protein [Elaeis guineensis]|uniref:uncharacterized protein isoform X2 n=2 Tax=Elaeis guineensis var. tenera TaxID=51953 RepID=UPI003C6D46AC
MARSWPVLLLLLLALLLHVATAKNESISGAILECRELASRSECQRSSRRCRWCRSDALDDMCFGSAEAWRLPHQGITLRYSSICQKLGD